ncbi:MAG: DUF2156 domain-containing protein [Bacteroidales bacterium]
MPIPFKPITIADRAAITSHTFQSVYRNCDFSFANMCSWRFLYKSEYAVMDGFLLIRFWINSHNRPVYMCPVGEGDFSQAVGALECDSLLHGHPLWLLGITSDSKATLDQAFPDGFHYIPARDYSDYIYLREDLVNLSGKKYQSKRNHINKFMKQYAYEYLPITPELVPECLLLESKWYRANRTADDAEELSYERRALTFALQHAGELHLTGGAICVDGQIVAFSFGSPINRNTFGVHVEKADIRYDGIYSMMNREFALHVSEQYTYINREEDLGIPGLRKAKLSYHPTVLLEKYTAVKKPE